MGLAPAANGANRTGRNFTGDRPGLATQRRNEHAGDGQRLLGARIVSTVRCAPPDNKPTIEERTTCAPWLLAEWRMVMPTVRVVLALGAYGWDASLRTARELGCHVATPKPRFGHGAGAELSTPDGKPVTLLGCYHPSQQNTSTGRLTTLMTWHCDDRARPGRLQGMQRISLEALARQQIEQAATRGGGHTADTVYGGHEKVLRQTVIGMIAGSRLGDHANPGEATVQVLSGRIRLTFGVDSWEARTGDLLIMPDGTHSLEALEDSALLLTVGKLH